DPELRKRRVGLQQSGRLAGHEEMGAFLRQGHTNLVRLTDRRQLDFVIGLRVELAGVVEEELDHRAVAVRCDDDDIRFAVAVEVAEGGAGRLLAPANDENVFLRDAKTRIGSFRLDETPADDSANVNALLKIMSR